MRLYEIQFVEHGTDKRELYAGLDAFSAMYDCELDHDLDPSEEIAATCVGELTQEEYDDYNNYISNFGPISYERYLTDPRARRYRFAN